MALFRKTEKPQAVGPDGVPLLGAGIMLSSTLEVPRVLNALVQAIASFRPATDPYQQAYVEPGWQWYGPPPAPSTAAFFKDRLGHFVLAALWPTNTGCEISLFPADHTIRQPRDLRFSIVADWKKQDPSLTSIGPAADGQIALTPPQLGMEYVERLLSLTGKESTPQTRGAASLMLHMGMTVKIVLWITPRTRDNIAAFLDTHLPSNRPGPADIQRLIDDFSSAYPHRLPDLQMLPAEAIATVMAADKPGTTETP
jgi:hypothetical protein